MKRPIPSSTVGWGFLLAAAVLAVFANCALNGFVWDDEQFIQKNAYLSSWRHLPELLSSNIVEGAGIRANLYRPLQSLSHFLDLRVWGLWAGGHHLTNILLHLAASAALFLVLTRLFSLPAAFLSAAFFSLHPLQSEAVAYISGRGDLMAFFFMGLTLLAFERSRALALGTTALALLSKEHMIMLPAFLLLFDHARGRRIEWKRHAPFWALVVAYVALRLTVLNFADTMNFYAAENVFTQNPHYRLFTYFTTAVKGGLLWVWPVDLHHERSWPVYTSLFQPKVAASLFMICGALLLAFSARRISRAITAGVLWFFAATFPTSNLVVMINAIFYDHWFLLPGFGFALVAGALLDRLPASVRTKGMAAFALLLLPLAWLTVRHNAVWRTPESLYTHILRFEPDSAKIQANLGMAYSDQGKTEEAIRHYRKAIQISDEYPQTHHNLGMAFLALGREEAAFEEFRRAVEIDPRFHHSHENLGILYLNRGWDEEARAAFLRAIEAYPYSPKSYAGLAEGHLRAGDRPAALAALERGLERIPSDPDLRRIRDKVRMNG